MTSLRTSTPLLSSLLEERPQIRLFEALDAKAGILVGFAGVLVALGRREGTPLELAALAFAGLGAMFGLGAFLLRQLPILEARRLRGRFLRSDPRFTSAHLLDATVLLVEQAAGPPPGRGQVGTMR